jgi:hypothetical protein
MTEQAIAEGEGGYELPERLPRSDLGVRFEAGKSQILQKSLDIPHVGDDKYSRVLLNVL